MQANEDFKKKISTAKSPTNINKRGQSSRAARNKFSPERNNNAEIVEIQQDDNILEEVKESIENIDISSIKKTENDDVSLLKSIENKHPDMLTTEVEDKYIEVNKPNEDVKNAEVDASPHELKILECDNEERIIEAKIENIEEIKQAISEDVNIGNLEANQADILPSVEIENKIEAGINISPEPENKIEADINISPESEKKIEEEIKTETPELNPLEPVQEKYQDDINPETAELNIENPIIENPESISHQEIPESNG